MTTVESMFTFQTNCTDAFTSDKMEPFAGYCGMSFESCIWQCSHHPRKCPTGLLCGPIHAPVPKPVTHAVWWFRMAQLGEPQNFTPMGSHSVFFFVSGFLPWPRFTDSSCCSFPAQQCPVVWTDHFVSPFIC